MASSPRSRSLYTGGRRSNWEQWAPEDVWSSEARKVPGRAVDYHKTVYNVRQRWIITRRTNYFHHCTSLHSPSASEQLGEVRADTMVSRWMKGTMCTKNVHRICAQKMCTENVHGFRTMAGTHRSRMGRSVPAHIVVFSLDRRRANSTLCVYQFSITIQLWTLWSPCLPAFNYFSIVAKLNARISMGLVSFQFAFTTQTLNLLSSNINLSRSNRVKKTIKNFLQQFFGMEMIFTLYDGGHVLHTDRKKKLVMSCHPFTHTNCAILHVPYEDLVQTQNWNETKWLKTCNFVSLSISTATNSRKAAPCKVAQIELLSLYAGLWTNSGYLKIIYRLDPK